MKIRTGFISNSSSSSFVLYIFNTTDKVIKLHDWLRNWEKYYMITNRKSIPNLQMNPKDVYRIYFDDSEEIYFKTIYKITDDIDGILYSRESFEF